MKRRNNSTILTESNSETLNTQDTTALSLDSNHLQQPMQITSNNIGSIEVIDERFMMGIMMAIVVVIVISFAYWLRLVLLIAG
jgi:hypothetical protein